MKPGRRILLSVIAIITILNVSIAQTKKCQALVLSGGGDLGAFEAGAILGLVQNAKDITNTQYDVVSGISAGSINVVGVAMYPNGQEQEMAQFLNSTWRSIGQTDVFKMWFGGLLEGLLFRSSLVNNEPLRATLTKLIKVPFHKKVVIGTTDANSGDYVIFTEKEIGSNLSLAVDSVIFSSSIPGIFPYQVYGKYAFQDGGVTKMFDLPGAVQRCLEIVDNQADITVDIITVSNPKLEDVEFNGYNTLQMLWRYLSITWFHIGDREFLEGYQDYPNVNFRYVIRPSVPMPNSFVPMDFDPVNIDFMLKQGYVDAVAAINKGEGITFKEAYEDAAKSVKARMQGVNYKDL